MEQQIFELLKKYHILTDTPTTPPDLQVVTESVNKEFLKMGITVEQLERSFEIGLKDDMSRVSKSDSNYYKVSGARFLSWMNNYHKMTHISNQFKESNTAVVTQDQKDFIAKEATQVCLSHFKKTGVVLDYGNAVYHYLWRIEEIRFNEDQWNEYVRQAEQIEHARLNTEREKSMDKLRRIEIDKELDEMMGDSEKIKSDARRLALKDYLERMVVND